MLRSGVGDGDGARGRVDAEEMVMEEMVMAMAMMMVMVMVMVTVMVMVMMMMMMATVMVMVMVNGDGDGLACYGCRDGEVTIAIGLPRHCVVLGLGVHDNSHGRDDRRDLTLIRLFLRTVRAVGM